MCVCVCAQLTAFKKASYQDVKKDPIVNLKYRISNVYMMNYRKGTGHNIFKDKWSNIFGNNFSKLSKIQKKKKR